MAAMGIGSIIEAVAGAASVGADVYSMANAARAQSQNAGYMNQEIGMQQQAQNSTNSAVAQEQAAAQPSLNYGQQMLSSAQQGQITPAQQQMVDQWTQQQQAQVNQYLAGSGQENSSAAQQWNQYIQQQADIMKQNFVTQNASQGMQATQVGLGGLGQAASASAGLANNAVAGAKLGSDASQAGGAGMGNALSGVGGAISSIGSAFSQSGTPAQSGTAAQVSPNSNIANDTLNGSQVNAFA